MMNNKDFNDALRFQYEYMYAFDQPLLYYRPQIDTETDTE